MQSHAESKSNEQQGRDRKAGAAQQAPATMPVQFKSRAIQHRGLGSGDVIVEATLDPEVIIQGIQGMLQGGPSHTVQAINIADCGIAAMIRTYVSTFQNTKQAFMDTGWTNQSSFGMGTQHQCRVTMTPEITNEKPRASQNDAANTGVQQSSGSASGSNSSNTSGVTGQVGVEGGGDGGKATGGAGANNSNTNGNNNGATGGSQSNGNFGTIMEDCSIVFNATVETKVQGLTSVVGGIASFFGANQVMSWHNSQRFTAGSAILRKPDPNKPR